jgi:hypothetical protein
MMIEASSKDFAQLHLNNCTFTKCSNFLVASGGSLVGFGDANCYYTDCQLARNKAGVFLFLIHCG